jgi:hypothetical protein
LETGGSIAHTQAALPKAGFLASANIDQFTKRELVGVAILVAGMRVLSRAIK